MKLLILNGPSMHLLGVREPEIYGDGTYDALVRSLVAYGEEKGITVDCRQSNHEGTLVDLICDARGEYDGIVLNAAAYTHTSIALLDALRASGVPAVEVHISDIAQREPFRRFSYPSLYCEKVIAGHGIAGYREAIDYFLLKFAEKA